MNAVQKWLGKIAAMFIAHVRETHGLPRITRTIRLVKNGVVVYDGNYDSAPPEVQKMFDEPQWSKWWESHV